MALVSGGAGRRYLNGVALCLGAALLAFPAVALGATIEPGSSGFIVQPTGGAYVSVVQMAATVPTDPNASPWPYEVEVPAYFGSVLAVPYVSGYAVQGLRATDASGTVCAIAYPAAVPVDLIEGDTVTASLASTQPVSIDGTLPVSVVGLASLEPAEFDGVLIVVGSMLGLGCFYLMSRVWSSRD